MIRQFVFLTLLGLAIVGCKAKKNVSTAPAEKNPAEEMATDSDEKVDVAKQMKMYGIVEKEYNDSIVISIERTACLGSCPTYKLQVNSSGEAYFNGMNFVDRIGEYRAMVSPDELQAIFKRCDELEYFKLDNVYWAPMTDVPSTYTSIVKGGKRKSVTHQSDGPQNLQDFEKELEEILFGLDWKMAGQ